MNRKNSTVLSVVLMLSVFHGTAEAQDASLQECQKLKKKIENYNNLRREGGSGAQMDAWKRARRKAEKSFRDSGCRQYRWELK